jgi:ATP-dependent helicase/nuclease subunit A
MIADAAERLRALDHTRSFIVQAPAGSGKTTLLVERFLKLLSFVSKPDEIVAITFTRKAAAEMRKRVLEKLPNSSEVAHRLRIETIDAFCLSLARQLPVPAQFGVPPGIAADPEPLYREAARNVLNLVERKEFHEKVARLLSHLDNNVGNATEMLARMLARRDQWLRKTGIAPTREELESAFASERKKIIQRAQQLYPRASEEFARLALKEDFGWRKKAPDPGIVGNEPIRLALCTLLGLPPEKYKEEQWAALEAMLSLLPLAAAELKLVFAARGEADFTEIAQGAVRALGSVEDPSDLLLKIDSKISHLLVDEFQDTSISQWELLTLLTAGWSPGDGRTLFVVGDPMQSIYRFREAEVGLFLQARRKGLPNVRLEPITLRTNFRSQENLVRFFNEAFEEVFPKEEDETSGAVPYSAAAPNDPALPGEAATWHICLDPVVESEKVIQLVREAEGTCAILVRNRSALADIVPALKAAGIRFRAIEIDKLGEKQVVQDLFALTRALTHLADRVAWLALLRAPWVGLSLADFLKHFENRNETVWELIQGVPGLERFRTAIAPALAGRQRGTLRDRVEAAWLALGGPACLAGDPRDATSLEDADAYLDALEKLEDAGEVDFARLAELLEELYAQPDQAATDADLQIMTIHKAKGLEFGTVIVPGLHRVPWSGALPLLRWKELPGSSLLLAPIKETGSPDEPAYDFLKLLDRAAEDTEAARLLYVAATRAEHRLHLLACPKKTMPPKRSLLARAWPVAAPIYEGAVPPESDKPASEEYVPFKLKRLPKDWTLPAAPPAPRWTPPAEGREEAQIEFSWAGETARHIGSVVHRWLQRIADDGLEGWDAKRVDAQRLQFEVDLVRRGVKDSELAAGLVATALKNTLADERGRWLLGPHPEAKSEYRVRTAGQTHVIDRMFREPDGTRWVVDYKTGRNEGADVERFLDRERERYAAQLKRYREVLKDARTGLYFPMHRGWREGSG